MTRPDFEMAPMPDASARDRAVHRVAEATHRLNEAVLKALEAGYTVELIRASRAHDGDGNWGDQIVPTVRMRAESVDEARAQTAAADAS